MEEGQKKEEQSNSFDAGEYPALQYLKTIDQADLKKMNKLVLKG